MLASSRVVRNAVRVSAARQMSTAVAKTAHTSHTYALEGGIPGAAQIVGSGPMLGRQFLTEGMAGARWGGVALFGIYWLLGPGELRDDIFFMLPKTGEYPEAKE